MWRRLGLAAVALFLAIGLGTAQAGDKGPRHHAEGQYDTVTATYLVVEGDDLIAIGERFEVSVDALKAHNKLSSDKIAIGQRLAIPGGPTGTKTDVYRQVYGKLGSPSADATISGKQLPAARAEVRRRDQGRRTHSPNPGGRRASCRPRRRPISC